MVEHEDTKRSDQELLFSSIADPAVFARIVDRYQAPFIRKALTILGTDEDAQDVVQEAFVKIYLNAEKFEPRASAAFSSWAYKILLNTCYSHYKKHKRARGDVSLDETLLVGDVDEVVEESHLERFLAVLSKIPASAARLLYPLVVEGKSYQDLARLEGVTDSTMRVRVHRAKSSFKKALIQNQNL